MHKTNLNYKFKYLLVQRKDEIYTYMLVKIYLVII